MSTESPEPEEVPPEPEAPAEPPPPGSAEPPPPAPAEPPPPAPAEPVAAAPAEPVAAAPRRPRHIRLLAIVVMIGGVILLVTGAFTWYVVRDQLSDEEITVSEDADHFGGDKVDGPLTAYAQADTINEHALEETDGLTYAQLDRDDPRRETAVTASFLRASLYTSVVAFGVAAFAFGIGLVLLIIGWALLRVDRSLRRAMA